MRFLVSGLAAFLAMFAFTAVDRDAADVANAAQVTFEVRAVGAQENPAVTGPGSALGRFTFDDQTRQLKFAVSVSGLSPNLVTASHIHRGATGVNGPIVHFISATGFTQVEGTITLSEADVADLRAGNFYLNVHSVDNPGGFARGQMILPAAAAPAPAPSTAPSAPAAVAAPVAPPRAGDAGLVSLAESTSLALAGLLVLTVAIGGATALVFATKRN